MEYVYIAAAFIFGWIVGKMKHRHKFEIKASTNLNILNVSTRFRSGVKGASKSGADIHAIYEVCKCGEDRIHVGDGTQDEFIFDSALVKAKLKEYTEVQALKNDLKI